jgi:hypothetical protein
MIKNMREILDRLGFEAISREDRPYLAEDFVFQPSDYASGRELRNVHEDLVLEESPLALFRQVHLQHAARAHTSLRLRLALCWNGFRDALSLLANYSQSFQRAIPEKGVVNAAEKYGTGDFGLAWAWSGDGEPDVLAFVKNNVFVGIEGHDAAALVRPLARELADALGKLRTGGTYGEERTGLLADVRRRSGEVPSLPPGGRLDLGVLPADDSTLFFVTSSGSVNRSPHETDSWYYRAGAAKGRQEIILFRVGKGILPIRERLTVEVK